MVRKTGILLSKWRRNKNTPTPEEAYSYGMILKSKVTLTEKINEILQEMLDDLESDCRERAVKYFGQDVADNISLYQK